MNLGTFAKRVELGGAWLDEVSPGWLNELDLTRLDVGLMTRCVLGQLDRVHEVTFANRSESLWWQVGFRSSQREYGDAVRYGFWLSSDELWSDHSWVGHETYAMLTDAWRAYVTRRRLEVTSVVEAS